METQDSVPVQPDIEVRDNQVEDRFELFAQGVPAGVLAYEVRNENVALVHTEIDPDFQGRGMGSELIGHALDQIRASGRGVLPVCPFVLTFLQRHPEYVDLVPPRYRAQYELSAE